LREFTCSLELMAPAGTEMILRTGHAGYTSLGSWKVWTSWRERSVSESPAFIVRLSWHPRKNGGPIMCRHFGLVVINLGSSRQALITAVFVF